MRRGDVAQRTFQDAGGTQWEVSEVHRASEAPRGVSPGLEKGWLSFVSAHGRRRLAPYPAEWETATVEELQGLCERARVANPPRFPSKGPLPQAEPPVPRPAAPRVSRPASKLGEEPNDVRDTVRAFAREARMNQMSAIAAMVRLKSVLSERFRGPEVAAQSRIDAADLRSVRRWFVEAFYFDRNAQSL